MADPQVDLAPGRLTGYRQWDVAGTGAASDPFRLISLTAKTVWPWTPEILATCHRTQIGRTFRQFAEARPHDPQDVPNAGCSCGIYAKYAVPVPNEPRVVSGVIEAWGPTVVGEHAFRARHARLVALCLDTVLIASNVAGYRQLGDDWTRSGWRRMPDGKDLVLPPEDAGMLHQLGQLYRVPVYDNTIEMTHAFPASDVSELLPPKLDPKLDPEPLKCVAGRCWCGLSGCTAGTVKTGDPAYAQISYSSLATAYNPALYHANVNVNVSGTFTVKSEKFVPPSVF